MKLITYLSEAMNDIRIGVLFNKKLVLDLRRGFETFLKDHENIEHYDAMELASSLIPNDVTRFIKRWKYLKPQISKAIGYFSSLSNTELNKFINEGVLHSLNSIKFLPVVPNPPKIVCIGLNFEEYRIMLKYPKPEVPLFFFKPTNTLIGHGDKVKIPKGGKWPGTSSTCLFHEYEMAVIIGRKMRNIDKNKALEHVFGATVFSDITAHDIEMKKPGLVLYQQRSKAFDTFSPIGPWIVTMDEIVEKGIDLHNLKMRRLRNGVVEGESNTKNMIYKVWEILEFLSEIMTLEPGDIVSLGSPPTGPKEGLHPGDIIEAEVEHIGTLRSYVE